MGQKGGKLRREKKEKPLTCLLTIPIGTCYLSPPRKELRTCPHHYKRKLATCHLTITKGAR
ncbi:hypothetical protein FH972_015018 [Carpinus fangiana]|uniref:Uncharacterized protein n=1 Tax=Carpinus fangiana TaxID=176857 RepID=A0A5N6RBU2_9ROSI|nr:hypothetical protein FH972_015018 [Carpinus fangiana]